MARRVVSEEAVKDAAKRGEQSIPVDGNTVVTPLARDTARQLAISFVERAEEIAKSAPAAGVVRKVAVGSDHGGFVLKEKLKPLIQGLGLEVVDKGTFSTDSVDYPDFAHAVAEAVANGSCERGIVIDGAGIGSAMAANKVPGIRAAVCWDISSAINSRQHNDANVLSLGARLLGDGVVEQIVRLWLTLPFEGGRHQGRVDKITSIEKKYLK